MVARMGRYAIVGAGAVGGAIGGTLARAGHAVTLVARGAHLEAIGECGLSLVTPEGTQTVRTAVLGDARALPFAQLDAIVIATKAQDTAAVLEALSAWQGPLVCAQNGVANERLARERFAHVLGVLVFAPLSHLEPGVVTIHAAAPYGGLEVGRWPAGADAVADVLAADLVAAGWDARAVPDIARWKLGKLLTNLGNVLEAVGGRAALRPELLRAIGAEAEACLSAARLDHASADDVFARFASVRELLPRRGGSTWQSLHRGLPLETDALNGEIVRLGRAHGVATPWNDALVALSARARTERWAPGASSPAALRALLPP